MPDFTGVGAAFAAVTQALDSAKALKELGKRIDNSEILSRVADLTLSLADVKIQLAQAHEENLELRRKLDEFSRMTDIRSKLRKEDNVYKTLEPIDGYGDGPFCMRCLDADGVLINLQVKHHNEINGRSGRIPAYDSYTCRNCHIKRVSGK